MWTSWSRRTAPTQRHHPCLWSRWTKHLWRRLLVPRPLGSSSSSRLCPCTWCQLWKRRQTVVCNSHEWVRKIGNCAILIQCITESSWTLTSFTSRLHHHTTSDGVEGVWDQTSCSGDGLSNHPADDDVRILGIWQHTCIWGRSQVTPVSREHTQTHTHNVKTRKKIRSNRCAHL